MFFGGIFDKGARDLPELRGGRSDRDDLPTPPRGGRSERKESLGLPESPPRGFSFFSAEGFLNRSREGSLRTISGVLLSLLSSEMSLLLLLMSS